MPTPSDARRLFGTLVRQSDNQINLAEAALLIAAGQGSDTHTELCLSQLSALAARVGTLLRLQGIEDPTRAPHETIATINKVLFEEEGFTGNEEDYYDVENSFLDRVLARRVGIPITLSIVYIEVARLVGLTLHGIGLPGHFAVGYWSPGAGRMPDIILDPFNEGQVMTLEDCAARVHAAYGEDVVFTPEWLDPMSHKQILIRVLNNLKHIHSAQDEHKAALRTIDMLLMLEPDAIWEVKERGILYYRTGAFVPALADLRRYLKHAPRGDDTNLLRYYVDLLQRLIVCNN